MTDDRPRARMRTDIISTTDPRRRRGIIITALCLAGLAVGFYVAFVLVTVAR